MTQNILQEENNIKRPLFWIAGAIVLGEVIAYWLDKIVEKGGFLSFPWSLALILLLLATGVLIGGNFEKWFRFIMRGKRSMWLAGFMLVFLGVMRMAPELLPHPVETAIGDEGSYGVLEGRLEKESLKNGSYTLLIRDASASVQGNNYKLSGVTVSARQEMWEKKKGVAPAVSGSELRIEGKLERFSGARNPGEFDYALYYRSQKLTCRMRASDIALLETDAPPLQRWVTIFRSYVSGALEFLCVEEDRGIYEAVILGDKAELSEDIRELYQKNGIAHLLAVSGLHVSLIGMGLYGGLRRLGLGYGKAGIAAAAVIFFYGCVTGFGASVFRAVFMLLCSFLASYLGRTYDLMSSMSLSLLLLALDSPFLIFTSGLQLSFGAVFSIGIAAEKMREWKKEKQQQEASMPVAGKQFVDGVFTSLFIQILTYPIILYHFFEFPIYGILLNLVVIPLMTYVVGAGIAGVFIYTLAYFLSDLFLNMAMATIGTGHYILAFYSFLCRQASRLPFYSVVGGRPDFWKLAIYYGAVFATLFWNKGSVAVRKKRFLAVSLGLMLLLCFHPVRGLEVTFLDVGQGDGIFLQTARYNILVDCGSSQIKNVGKSRLVPFLKSKGVSRLDFVFVSHGDLDHISGIEYLLQENTGIWVKNLVFSGIGKAEESCERLAKLSKKQGSVVQYMQMGDRISLGKLILTCVYPSETTRASDKNEQSLVLLADYGEISFLLTGDIKDGGEAEILREGQGLLPEGVTVLKAAHHGSDSSSGEDFLKRVNPEIAVLSYGNGNSYGHPSGKVIEGLEEVGTRIWRTGDSGAIKIVTDGSRMEVMGFIDN